jgi:hypothetical protein
MTTLARFKDLCLDANDHQMLARWWCDLLGYEISPTAGGTSRDPAWPVPIRDPTGQGPLIWINPVPEKKTVKNRMHLDVWGRADGVLARGATLVRARDGDIDWDVLADPEGNEFCVFSPPG